MVNRDVNAACTAVESVNSFRWFMAGMDTRSTRRQQMTYDMNELSASRNYLARAFLLEKRRATIALRKY